jgi:5-methylcytosine-specific restriction enzyme A
MADANGTRRYDARSDEAAEYRRLYNTARWRKIRLDHLRRSPVCVMCLRRGLVNDGSMHNDGKPQEVARRRHLVCDHVEPHKGDVEKFYGGPFQTLCPDDHDIVKQQLEVRGFMTGSDMRGRPIDPDHPWNRARAVGKARDSAGG